jgi:hypothetical protein
MGGSIGVVRFVRSLELPSLGCTFNLIQCSGGVTLSTVEQARIHAMIKHSCRYSLMAAHIKQWMVETAIRLSLRPCMVSFNK